MVLLARLSPSQNPLRCIVRASGCWILSCHIVAKLKRRSTFVKVIRRYFVSAHLAAMIPLLVELCRPGLFYFAVNLQFSMDEARARILGSDGTLCFISGAVDSDLHDDEIVPYPDDNQGDDWDFADVPVDSHVNVCANHSRYVDAIREVCCSANVAVLADASEVFSLALQNLDAIMKRPSAVASMTVARECVCFVK